MSVHNDKLFEASGLKGLQDARIAIVHTRWNAFIVDELVKGCKETLIDNGITKNAQDLIEVPGSIEIPFACKHFFEAAQNKEDPLDAIIAFGCVIRGETPHFDYVCQSVTDGVTLLNLSLPVPIIFGVLTVNCADQAQERIGGKHGHKGEEAALSALQMIAFNRGLK